MKYTVQSGKYIFKNFLYIFPFAIIPAFCFCLSTDDAAIHDIYKTLLALNPNGIHFDCLFRAISMLNFGSWSSSIAGTLGIVLIVICVSMMMALIEKHMRIGKRTYTGVFSKLNDNFISTCGYALLVLAIYELWTLITSALVFALSRIPIVALAYSLMGIVFLGMHLLLIYAIGIIYLWLPCMQITGFRAIEALYYSYNLIRKAQWKMLLGQLFCLLFTEAIVAAVAIFAPDTLLFHLIGTGLYSIIIMIYCVRMFIAYFDRENLERADLHKYYRH